MEKIYLDNAATTVVDPEALEAMEKVYRDVYGNPSSIHTVGQEARAVVDKGRETVAKFLNCEETEVIFTSGGSESDNLAIKGIIDSGAWKGEGKPHVITTATEHHAVLHTVQELEKEGKIEATYLTPDKAGLISAKQVLEAIRPNTILVSIIYVNNETGVAQDIAGIAQAIRNMEQGTSNKNNETRPSSLVPRPFIHTDAVQAAEWMEMDVEKLGVDLLTFTAHKIHGPKGIGVLFAKKGTPIKAQITGGDQELRLRAGTENVAAISGFSTAITEVARDKERGMSVEKFRDKLEQGIVKSIPEAIVNGNNRAPHILNVSFLNAEGEAIILNLDFLGIAVSSGSACTSRSLDPSHVLTAMGIPPEKAHGSIRFSLSRYTTEKEIDKVLEVLPGIIKKLREMSPFKQIN